jgi:drug/metabolite transporter (DMT)-like permease
MKRVPLALALGLLAVSGAAVLVRLAPDVPAPSAAFWRLAIAAGAIWLVLGVRGEVAGARETIAVEWRGLAAAGVALGAHFALWFASLHRTSVAASVVLVTTSPLQAAVAEMLLFGERLGTLRSIGLVLGFAGAVALSLATSGGDAGSLGGNVLAFLGGTAAAAYFLAGRRTRARTHVLPYTAGVYSVAAVSALVLALVTRSPLGGFAPGSWLALLALGCIPQLLGHTALNWALRYLPAAGVAGVTLGEPLGASILAAAVLGEMPPRAALGGAVLSLAGVACVVLAPRD